jgi:hypothetical protein
MSYADAGKDAHSVRNDVAVTHAFSDTYAESLNTAHADCHSAGDVHAKAVWSIRFVDDPTPSRGT